MCLIVFRYKSHNKYPLILAGNRDEFYARPSKEAHFWDTEPPLLAGKDLEAGGTWLGISTTGLIGAVTNYRDLNNPKMGEKSRGELITGLLTHKNDLQKLLKSYVKNGEQYNGFNLIAGSKDDLYYISNISNNIVKLKPGLYGVSNAFLDTSWPKVDTAKSEFERITSSDEINEEEVFKLLKNRESFPIDKLPQTGLTPEMEKEVSPVFIETENYGTRCSTLLMIDKHGVVTFIERSFPVEGEDSETEKKFQFKITNQSD